MLVLDYLMEHNLNFPKKAVYLFDVCLVNPSEVYSTITIVKPFKSSIDTDDIRDKYATIFETSERNKAEIRESFANFEKDVKSVIKQQVLIEIDDMTTLRLTDTMQFAMSFDEALELFQKELNECNDVLVTKSALITA